jgi:hypothetical protein
MKKQTFSRSFVLLAALACTAPAAYAFLRHHYSDHEVVARAELIVVAKMRPGSLVFVAHTNRWHDPPICENHLELLVSEVLKGQLLATSVVISVKFGYVLVGGQSSDPFWGPRYVGTNYPKDVVEIFDGIIGNTEPITGDIRTNHIWLLRHDRSLTPSPEANFSSENPAIYDPEDIQPIARRKELVKYLK